MKNYIILLSTAATLLVLTFMSCEKTETPKQVTTETESVATERRGGGGGNGGGNGNGSGNSGSSGGGTTNENNPTYWPVVYPDATDFNVTIDTSICGFLILKWDAQPNFTAERDSQYALIGKYFIRSTPITYASEYPCQGGLYTTTNALYYAIASGCSFFGGHTYNVEINYFWKDTLNQVIVAYRCSTLTVQTGRNPWMCN